MSERNWNEAGVDLIDPRSPEGERIGMSRYCDHLEALAAALQAERTGQEFRIAQLEEALLIIVGHGNITVERAKQVALEALNRK